MNTATTAAASSLHLLLFRDSPGRYQAMSPQERQDLLERWNSWHDRLVAAGKLQQGHPLEPEGRVVTGPLGDRVIDGPFAESKESVGGFFLLTVADIDEATAIARECPGLEYGLSVEVRPVGECCPILRQDALQGETHPSPQPDRRPTHT